MWPSVFPSSSHKTAWVRLNPPAVCLYTLSSQSVPLFLLPLPVSSAAILHISHLTFKHWKVLAFLYCVCLSKCSPTDKFGMERYLYEGQCVAACPEAFYHTQERSCERCSDHCRLCTSAMHCLKCNSSYYVSEGSCLKLDCGEGQSRSM